MSDRKNCRQVIERAELDGPTTSEQRGRLSDFAPHTPSYGSKCYSLNPMDLLSWRLIGHPTLRGNCNTGGPRKRCPERQGTGWAPLHLRSPKEGLSRRKILPGQATSDDRAAKPAHARRRGTSPHLVLFVLPSFGGGGAERVTLTLMAALDRQRFAPELVIFEPSGPLQGLVPDDVPVRELHRRRLRSALPVLINLVRRIRPKALFATQGYVNLGLLLARPLLPRGTRIAVRESNTPSQNLPTRRHPLLTTLGYRFLYPTADMVFCQHRLTETELVDRFHVPAARIQRLPNPVDTDSLRRAASLPRREPGGGLRFVAAGRLVKQKGFDRLIDIMSTVPSDCRLTIFGEGPDEEALRSRTKRLGLAQRIRFAGFSNALAPWLAGADAVLIPSRWEGMPNVALEALCCGTPVLATPEAGGIAELAGEVRAGAVTLAEPGPSFTAAMMAVAANRGVVLRPSLLPRSYELSEATARFSLSLEDLCAP